MPTASRTAVCSLTTPVEYSSGIDQPPNSANFAPSATCRSCSGEVSGDVRRARLGLSAVHGANLPRLSCVGDHLHAAQRQPREDPCDAVVVGVVQGGKGPDGGLRSRRAARRSPRPTAASFRPLLASLGVTGKAGEVVKVPTGKQLVVAAAGPRRARQARAGRGARPRVVRRAAGAAARVGHQRRLGRARAAGRLARAGARGDRGLPARRLHVHDVQEEVRRRHEAGQPGEVVVLSPSARARRSSARPSRTRRSSPTAVAATRDWVNTPPGDFTPAELRRRRRRPRPRTLTKGRGAPKVDGQGPRREGARRARLRRHPRGRRAARPRRRGWSS